MDTEPDLPTEDIWRANTYAFLAIVLAAPPNSKLLALLEERVEDLDGRVESPISRAWQALVTTANGNKLELLSNEYHETFIGITNGRISPYGSFYQTGFLNEEPLARLRSTLIELGFERDSQVHEPEDHAAILFNVMCVLIMEGTKKEDTKQERQRRFFQAHIAPWMALFFDDLAQLPGTPFYAAIGRLGQEFIAIETRYLDANGL